jgi:hypothetical protein
VAVLDGEVNLTASTVSENSGGYSGGGLFVAFASATVSNSTISNNYGTWGAGTYSIYENAVLTLDNSTVIGNTGPDGYPGGGVFSYYGGETDMSGTVVAANGASDCAGSPPIDSGNNFSSDGSCPGSAAITPGVDIDTTLADNGGPTETHALPAGSVAIDAAGSCGLVEDQRGYGRDASCDSGAFESSGSCELVLEGDGEAVAGVPTELDVHCATPEGQVAFVGGRSKGSKVRAVPGCGPVEFGVVPPRKFGVEAADNEGGAFSDQTLPPEFVDNSIFFQAIDFATCELTNVIEVIVSSGE